MSTVPSDQAVGRHAFARDATQSSQMADERGRKRRLRTHHSSRPTSSRSAGEREERDSAMGQQASKLVSAVLSTKSKSKSPARTREIATAPAAVAAADQGEEQQPSSSTSQLERHESICQSPTWSPRGSLAARRQADKDRRELQRQQRKEADEARRRLKEEEKRRKQVGASVAAGSGPSISSSTADAASGNDRVTPSHSLRPSRRLTKQPPPAAMETQRMPTALRSANVPSDKQQQQQQQPTEESRRRRSSSLSSVFRMVTGSGRSRSKQRAGNGNDDEAYMSDASMQSRSSFIGGVKLQNAHAKAAVSPRPLIDESAIHRDSVDFGAQMQAQMDSITARASIDAVMNDSASQESKQANNKADASSRGLDTITGDSRAGSAAMNQNAKIVAAAHGKDSTKTQDPSQQTNARPNRMSSVRIASMNRMEKLVIPLRSAMKGGREIAAAGRANTMPIFTSNGQPVQTQTAPSDYVRRSRLRDNARSMAGWQDEMAIEKANEQAVAEATAKAVAGYGPQMPPTPDASIDNLPRPSKESADASKQQQQQQQQQQPLPQTAVELPGSEPEQMQTPTSPVSPGDMDHVVWKQPIRANKQAAASRVEESQEQKSTKNTEPSDIDTLPSQKPRQSSTSQALKPAAASGAAPQPPPKDGVSTRRSEREAPDRSEERSPDSIDSGLRRQPAVMSWKAEKDKNGKVLSSAPRSPPMPAETFKPAVLPPEQHPSLAALRTESDANLKARSGTMKAAELSNTTNLAPGHEIERPFSIVPTPAASPIPGDLISMAMPRPTKAMAPIRRHSTPIEAIEEARTATKESVAAAAKAPVFPFPDRHVTLRRPERKAVQRDAESSDSGRQESDREAAGNRTANSAASGKVTFHTPPESPRYRAVSTSYDAYRRPYSTSKVSPSLAAAEPDDIELPVPVSQLGKPNPPFAREGKSPAGRRSRESSSSPRRAPRRTSSRDGSFVYLPFSPAASSTSLNLGAPQSKLKGFKFKNPDGTTNMDFAAKVFVICCGCKKWHDIPSALYREMSKGLREIDSQKDGVAEARPPTHGGGGSSSSRSKDRSGGGGGSKDESEEKKRRKRRDESSSSSLSSRKRSGVITTVPCCWCEHEMSTRCCEGWTTICFKHAQHHVVERDDAMRGAGAGAEGDRVRRESFGDGSGKAATATATQASATAGTRSSRHSSGTAGVSTPKTSRRT